MNLKVGDEVREVSTGREGLVVLIRSYSLWPILVKYNPLPDERKYENFKSYSLKGYEFLEDLGDPEITLVKRGKLSLWKRIKVWWSIR